MGAAKAKFHFSLCADDYALSPAVSRGVLEAIDAGRLMATSCLVTRPAWPLAARALQQRKTKADIGLHFNLTLGSPLAPMPLFAPAGIFPGPGEIVRQGLKRNLPEGEIGQEIARQIDKFCEHFLAPPDFADGHHHIHAVPQVRSQLFRALEEKGFRGRIWLRDPGDGLARILRRGLSSAAKALGVAWMARGFSAQARMRGFATNDGFAGFSAFDPKQSYAGEFARYLLAPGTRHLVMCHPGYCDEELDAADSVTISREQELRFLLSPAFDEILESNGAQLVRLSARLSRALAGN
ncbi:MAG: ChbG/HpnK family deacetylase [Methylocapsa sp.]|nr:ChbG/HpnK family deacetylase [Methylocapsa sp.]